MLCNRILPVCVLATYSILTILTSAPVSPHMPSGFLPQTPVSQNSAGSDALIIPQELPSILSLIYSNLPPLKKGTDSRFGFGFRFGEHADFQVLIQLGPQTETQPIGPQPENNGNSKRHVIQQTFYIPNGEEIITDTQGGKWLSSWRSAFTTKKKVNLQETKTEIPTMAPDPTQSRNQVVTHLRKLYTNTNKTADTATDTRNSTQVE